MIGSNNVIQSNAFSKNKKDGIFLTADNNNTVYSNEIGFNSLVGIRLYNSTYNTIHSNNIFNNSDYGAYLDLNGIKKIVLNVQITNSAAIKLYEKFKFKKKKAKVLMTPTSSKESSLIRKSSALECLKSLEMQRSSYYKAL